jgi:hypothetical protein
MSQRKKKQKLVRLPKSQRKQAKKQVRTAQRQQKQQSQMRPRGFNAPRAFAAVGNQLFGPIGGQIAGAAGKLFRKVTGWGDYKVNGNSLMGAMDALPGFRSNPSGTRIVHREYLNDVITAVNPGTFQVQTIPIQPGLLTAFPWLSATAENFQQYRLNGVIYEFKSNSADALNSTNTALGTVIMTTDYNVLDPPFASKFQMEQTEFTSTCKPSCNLMHPIECSPALTPTPILYTRPGPVTQGDLRLYDWGNFQIATQGMQGIATNIGELWVTYDISLLKPKLAATSDVYDHYVLSPLNISVQGPNWFGSTTHPPVLSSDSDMGTTIAASGGTNFDTIVWPPGYTGKVMVVYYANVNSISQVGLATQYTVAILGGVGTAVIKAFSGNFETNEGSAGKRLVYNTSGGATYTLFLNIVNGGSMRISAGGTTGVAVLSADVFVIALPNNFFVSALPAPTSLPPLCEEDEKIPVLSVKPQPRLLPLTLEEKRRLSDMEPLRSGRSASLSPRSTLSQRDADGDYVMSTPRPTPQAGSKLRPTGW